MNCFLPVFLYGKSDHTVQIQDRILQAQHIAEVSLFSEAEQITYDLTLMEKSPELMHRLKPNLPELTLCRIEQFRTQVGLALENNAAMIEAAQSDKKFLSTDWLASTASPAYKQFQSKILEDLTIINKQASRIYDSADAEPEDFGRQAAVKVRDQQNAENLKRMQGLATPSLVQPIMAPLQLSSEQVNKQIRDEIMACHGQIRTRVAEDLARVRLDAEVAALYPQLAAMRPNLRKETIEICNTLTGVTCPSACRSLKQIIKEARSNEAFSDHAWLDNMQQVLDQVPEKMRVAIHAVQTAVNHVWGVAFVGEMDAFAPNDSLAHQAALAVDKQQSLVDLQRRLNEMNAVLREHARISKGRRSQAAPLRRIHTGVVRVSKKVNDANVSLQESVDQLPLPARKVGLVTGAVVSSADLVVHLTFAKCAVGVAGVVGFGFVGHVVILFAVSGGVAYAGCAAYNMCR